MKLLKLSTSALTLIVANLVPLYGALFAGWNVFSIMILYWLESAIIGGFTLKKMMIAEGNKPPSFSMTMNGVAVNPNQPAALLARTFFIPFFSLHYGIFMFVHLIFLVVFFGILNNSGGFDFGGILIGFLSLLFSHAMSYKTNFIGRGEYRVLSPEQLFLSPYPRIIVMHLTIILGGMFALSTGQSATGLALMIILKIITDLGAHLFEHGQIGKRLL